MSTFSLSFHAHYRCRDSGLCCSSGWPIPVEAERLIHLQKAVASGDVIAPSARPSTVLFLTPEHAPPDTPAMLATVDGRCVFHDADAHRCAIHRALGHDALPLACRQFPRVSLHDPRGTSVTLSHYCPTSLAMLDGDGPVSIEIDAGGFESSREHIGLDARMALPPLLRHDMLMDWESWWRWEALAVRCLAGADEPPRLALARLAYALSDVIRWSPRDGTLHVRIEEAFERAGRASLAPLEWSPDEVQQRRGEVLAAIPSEWRPLTRDATRATAAPSDRAVSRLLAAHAFANWPAHLGKGLRTWLRSVEAPLALMQSGMDAQTTDLWLRHLADTGTLAGTWDSVVVNE